MADYFRVSPKFWRDSKTWGERNQIAALYLLTCDHRTTEGLYVLPKGYVIADLGWPPAAVDKAFKFLEREQFMAYDEHAEVVFVRNALKYQAPATKNQIEGAIRRLLRVPPTSLWRGFLMACECHCEALAHAIRDRIPEAFAFSSSSSSSSSRTPSGDPTEKGADERERAEVKGTIERSLREVDAA